MMHPKGIPWAAVGVAVAAWLVPSIAAGGEEVRLKYLGRYEHQPGPDHLMGVEGVLDHHALVSSNFGLALVDLEALPTGGTQSYVDRLTDLDAFASYTREDGYVYVHLRQGGFAVVYLDESALTLSLVTELSEPGVYFEKMCLQGDRLYVTAHAYGIRVYDLTDPAAPVLIGSLDEGFDDAFAIDVSGTTGYVADGAGGLKIVDLSDESAPVIIAGETTHTAAGTAQDVTIIGDHVYVGCGGAGVGVYDLGDLGSRVVYNTPICAKQLARVGDLLAAADIGGLEVFRILADGALERVAGESAMYRSTTATTTALRLWHGVSAWGDDHVLSAGWTTMDVFRLVDPATDDQPDVTLSRQRIRFAPAGGSTTVTMRNDGSGALQATSIYSSEATFTVQPGSAVLQPGESIELSIEYAGGLPGSALVKVDSNDPDENPLAIRVFGETSTLDPGEPAEPFTLPLWTYDHDAGEFTYGSFDLESHAGKIVYFHVYASW